MAERKIKSVSDADREIVVTRVFDAPRERVWEAWTDPKQVARWWGPNGFTTKIEKMDFRVGGQWKHMMHGPDGTDYPNESTFTEIVKNERICYSHAGGSEAPCKDFVWTFEDAGAGKTKLTLRIILENSAERDKLVKEFGVDKGAHQTLGRFNDYLAVRAPEAFTITRVFDAPRDLVFKVWTERDHLLKWFGPKGMPMKIGTLDLRPGGTFHYCLALPDGKEMWGKWTFRDIASPESIVLISSFSDAAGGITTHPFAKDWPRETLSATTLEEENGKTRLTLRWVPYNATDAERKVFSDGHASMEQGWGGTMEALTNYLATL